MSTANDLVDFEAQVTLTRAELNELLICIERTDDGTMSARVARQALWDKLFDAGQDAINRMQT